MELPESISSPSANLTVSASLRAKLETRLSAEQLVLVDEALECSRKGHEGQSRADGRPYIIHPLAVADVLADWEMDCQSIVAALLHDLIEDTGMELAEIERRFGSSVASLVDGVSKIEKLETQGIVERQAENFRKILMAISKDWRVIFIKLGDRLHNIRTLSHISDPQKRKRIARETIEIYAPIAVRLGMSTVSRELEDLSFRHLHPHRCRVLTKALRNMGRQRRNAVESIRKIVAEQLMEHKIDATITGRAKNVYSIYRKMIAKKLSFSEVDDIVGFRIVVKDRLACYSALGVLHMCFQPVPTKLDDYIAVPKSNGYQSLHTTVKDTTGMTIELQIRTGQMHAFAEQGLAAHWLYKRGGENITRDVQLAANHQLQGLMKLHSESKDSTEFLENVKVELYPQEIYVMSPKGEIYSLPKGATALDFAYLIHSDVGDSASFVRVNGKPMPLSTVLETGNVVSVERGERTNPLPHWLSFVTTARARSQIRHQLRNAQVGQTRQLGRQLLISAFNKMGSDLQDVSEERWKALFSSKPFGTHSELYREIGIGKVSSDLIVYELLDSANVLERKRKRKTDSKRKDQTILIGSATSAAIKLAECCNPLPGEPIIGLLHKGRGLKIHLHICPELPNPEEKKGNWIDVSWDSDAVNRRYVAPISLDCKNRPGITSRIFTIIADNDVNIEGFSMKGGAREHEHVSMHIQIEVNSAQQCENLIQKLRADQFVNSVRRELKRPAPEAVP